MVMMDAWACNFCRHILSQEGSQPILRLEDSNLLNCRWRWQGRSWQAVHPGGKEVTAAVWVMAAVITLLPPTLLWLTYHTFPPLPDTGWPWFPPLWLGLTISAHVTIVLWILLGHYQITPYLNWRWRSLGNGLRTSLDWLTSAHWLRGLPKH
jgi:hypothetical protein